MKHPVPRLRKLFKSSRAADPLPHVQMPIARGDSPGLPILPTRVFLNRGPKLLRRINSGDQVLHRAGHINADQNPPNIKNNRPNLPSRHAHLASSRTSDFRALRIPLIAGSTETNTTTAIT